MGLLITGTMINLGVNLIFYYVMLRLYRKTVDLGKQKVEFTTEQIRVRGRWRRVRAAWLYRVNFSFRGCRQSTMATTEEYLTLLQNQTGSVMVHVREFPAKILSPNLEKYEFSLQAVDWDKKDRQRCRKGFAILFVFLEAVLWMMASGI